MTTRPPGHPVDPRLVAARAADSLLTLEGYCRGDCPVREVTIAVKDHDRDLLALVGARGLSCPICGRPLTLHWVRTRAEQYEADAREARCFVNTQIYQRDHADGPHGLCLIPASVMCNDRLPGATKGPTHGG
jgi:hypothetical protein